MRRVAHAVVVAGLLGLRIVGAEPLTLSMETGAELDTNVERVESGEGMPARIAAAIGRAGARIDQRGHVLDGAYALDVSGLARMVASSQAKDENVMLYSSEARWLHAIGSRPIATGVSVTAADSFAIMGGIGARTFRNLGADALLALSSTDDRHLSLAIGARDFVYKPSHEFDWKGPVVNARIDVVLWQAPGKTRSLELGATLGFEARSYGSDALTDICPAGPPPGAACSAGTSLPRRDRYQRAGVELTWSGDVVVSAGYQLTVVDSNSYGQSLVRHRITSSATTELADKLYGTLTAALQIDEYPDGFLVETDLVHQELTNLEDENRSSLQIRVARELSDRWSLEARGAVWRDLGNADTGSFRRELLYGGVIYSR